jgi:hypothetical protein
VNDATSPELTKDVPPGGAKPAGRPRSHVLAVTAVVCYFLFGLTVPLVPVSLRPDHMLQFLVMQLAVTLVFMALQLWTPWTIAATRPTVRTSIIGTLACAAGWAVTLVLLSHVFQMPPHNRRPAVALLQPLNGLLMTVGLAYLGGLISRIIREAKILLPVGIIAGVIDVVGAMTPIGYTADVVAKHPNVVKAVSVAAPTVGSLAPMSLVGPGDLLFLGFFFATVIRFGMNGRASYWLTYILLTLSMLVVQFSRSAINIGALMPMGVAMIAANFRYFKFTREETFAMLYAGVIVLALTMIFFVVQHNSHHVPHHP